MEVFEYQNIKYMTKEIIGCDSCWKCNQLHIFFFFSELDKFGLNQIWK
jgi:hypothetical protein